MKRKGWWTLLGLVAGAAAAWWLARAYQAAREKCPPFRRRVYADSQRVIDAFGQFWRNPDDLKALRNNERLDRRFAAKIMLAVTAVNGCRYCSYAHTRHAIHEGLSQEEVSSLLRGDMEHATLDQAPALFFAQHYAEQCGQPEADMIQRLMDTYGAQTAHDMITYIRLITLGNLVGNTFDALVSRVLGNPSPDTTLRSELSVLAVFGFGIVPLMPLLALRAAWASCAS